VDTLKKPFKMICSYPSFGKNAARETNCLLIKMSAYSWICAAFRPISYASIQRPREAMD